MIQQQASAATLGHLLLSVIYFIAVSAINEGKQVQPSTRLSYCQKTLTFEAQHFL